MFQQPFQSLFVGLRVGTFRVSGCEMLDFMFFVERLYGAVDPSEAKGFLDSVVVCNTFFALRFGGEYKPNVIGVFKVVCQPFSPIFSVFKIFYFHSAKKNSNPLLRIGCC